MQQEVHVGDIGTKYRVRVRDEGGDFDPSSAATKQLIFRMPGGITLIKDATVEVGSGSEVGRYYLAYTVVAADGEDGADFHAAPGIVVMQGYLAWADGKRYHSDKTSRDEDGRRLQVVANLLELST